MTAIKSIKLEGRIAATPLGINFLRAEWWGDLSRFVVIRYSERDGIEGSLRMDIDKRAFIDHIADPAKDEAVQSQALPIWEILAKLRNKHDWSSAPAQGL
jgi:hypothetical protein